MPPVPDMDFAARLLDWYQTSARVLPWRSPPGQPPPDPYRVWLSEVMLQQTTVAAVTPRFVRFVARWPGFRALAAAEEAEVMSEWAGLGYYARARNMLKCARAVVDHHGGDLPQQESELRRLPGIGRYTAAAIAAIAFGRRAVVIDGNVERIVARLFAVATPMPQGRAEIASRTDAITPSARSADFAQAMMDLGATLCVPRAPRCGHCPLVHGCRARAAGSPSFYPVKAPRPERPVREGTGWWIERDGHVLLVRRPAAGLLGSMRALPSAGWDGCTDWTPLSAGRPAGLVEHGFTHFTLRLSVERISVENGCQPPLSGEWWPIDRIDEAGLPTAFRKAARLAMSGS